MFYFSKFFEKQHKRPKTFSDILYRPSLLCLSLLKGLFVLNIDGNNSKLQFHKETSLRQNTANGIPQIKCNNHDK